MCLECFSCSECACRQTSAQHCLLGARQHFKIILAFFTRCYKISITTYWKGPLLLSSRALCLAHTRKWRYYSCKHEWSDHTDTLVRTCLRSSIGIRWLWCTEQHLCCHFNFLWGVLSQHRFCLGEVCMCVCVWGGGGGGGGVVDRCEVLQLRWHCSQ